MKSQVLSDTALWWLKQKVHVSDGLHDAVLDTVLTVAAPLTCTDLLAVDRVPGTRSTDGSGASFGFASATFTSLKTKSTNRRRGQTN